MNAAEIPATTSTGDPTKVSTEIPAASSEDPAKVNTEIPKPETGLFTLTDSGTYYFIVNVLDPSVNLSSSRFGIGQFNRTNFAGGGIKHQLKTINNQNQLIFVGEFLSKNEAADYYQKIKPLLFEIMKISPDKYTTFYISKQNLDKLKDRETVDHYLEFYQKNF